MILPQPCRQVRGKSSTHHWSCDPRVGQTTTALFSFYPPIGPRHGKQYAGYNPKLLGTQKPGNSQFLHRERQSNNAKAKITQMLLFKYIKAAITQKGFGIFNLSCIRESMLLGISSLSQDRCLSCLKPECFIAFYVLSLYSILPFSDYSHLYLQVVQV